MMYNDATKIYLKRSITQIANDIFAVIDYGVWRDPKLVVQDIESFLSNNIMSLNAASDTGFLVKNFETACQDLAEAFLAKYYPGCDAADMYWIGGRVGEVLNIGDEYWNMERMREALEYNATSDQLFDYYYADVDAAMQNKPLGVSFKNYVLYNIPFGEVK